MDHGQSSPKLTGMTIAAERMDEMVAFYRQVFGADLRPVERGGVLFYEGSLAGLDVVMCSREIAGVSADNNVHQLSFKVSDVTRLEAAASAAGGERIGESGLVNGKLHAWIRDPDGNSVELAEA